MHVICTKTHSLPSAAILQKLPTSPHPDFQPRHKNLISQVSSMFLPLLSIAFQHPDSEPGSDRIGHGDLQDNSIRAIW